MKRISLFLITASLLLGNAQSAAAASLHQLNTYGAFLDGSAAFLDDGFGPNSGIVLPDSGVPKFAFSFTVPLDHVPGNPLVVGVTWHVATPAPCTANLSPNFISVARIGSTHIQGPSASTGLSPADGQDTLVASVANASELKLYVITAPDGVTQLQPLDVVTFGLFRSAAALEDTCTGSVRIQGTWILVL